MPTSHSVIPAGAQWYLADIVEQITVEDDPRQVILILIRAGSPEDACQEALSLGSEAEITYENPQGKSVSLRFHGLNELTVIDDELEHGAELSYREIQTTDESSVREWIKLKDQLGIFSPRRPRSGPDYTSKSIVEEARNLLR